MSRKKRKERGPESARYDELKGNLVRVWPPGAASKEETWIGLLVWVDIYTVGVAFNWNADPNDVSIVYKDSIRIDYHSQVSTEDASAHNVAPSKGDMTSGNDTGTLA